MKFRAIESCKLLIVLLLALGVSACSSNKKEVQIQEVRPQTHIINVAKPAPKPEGVMRYCWVEPVATTVRHAPGVNYEGTWYNPAYTAVRQVKLGKWRPCSQK